MTNKELTDSLCEARRKLNMLYSTLSYLVFRPDYLADSDDHIHDDSVTRQLLLSADNLFHDVKDGLSLAVKHLGEK